MKLIAKYNNTADADVAAARLELVGIVTHVSNRGAKSLGFLVHNLAPAGLWAVLDHQHEDAVQYLEDDKHIVTSGLTPDELERFERNAEATIFDKFNNAIMYGVVIIALLVLLLVYLGEL